MPVSTTLQARSASGTGELSAARAEAVNLTVAVSGTSTSALVPGRTASSSTARCTSTSTVFCCSSPVTVSVALPDPTAFTTPVRLTCATL